jgi:hypothetical protein
VREYINERFAEYERHGLVKKLSSTQWAQNIHAVKKDKGNYRMTMDARDLNNQLERETGQTLNVESNLYKLDGSRLYNTLDLTKAFWQIPLEVADPPIVVARTQDGDYALTRLPQGIAPAAFHCQDRVSSVVTPAIPDNSIIFQDDVFNFAGDELENITVIEKLLRAAMEKNMIFNPKKSDFFLKKAIWVGLIIEKGTWRFTDEWREGILKLDYPNKGDELSSFLHGSNWGRSSLRNYAAVTAPLWDLLKDCSKEVKSNKKTKLKSVKLAKKWGKTHATAWDNTKKALDECMRHAFPSRKKVQCMWTDASDDWWCICITQIAPGDASKYLEAQDHEFLFWLSGRFSETACKWHILSKEAFPIIKGITRLSWLLQTSDYAFRIYTDSKVVSLLFNHKRIIATNSKSSATRLARYALLLQEYYYIMEHIMGIKNHLADLGTRPPTPRREAVHFVRMTAEKPFGEEIPEDANSYQSNDYKCAAEVFTLVTKLEPIDVDCFSSDLNKQACAENITATEDAFNQKLEDGVGWMNVPYNWRTRAIKWGLTQVSNNMVMWILHPDWKQDKSNELLQAKAEKIYSFPKGVRLFSNPDKGVLKTPWRVNLWRCAKKGKCKFTDELRTQLTEWVNSEMDHYIDISYRPLLDEKFKMPDLQSIIAAQEDIDAPIGMARDRAGLIRNSEGKLWIPATPETFLLRQSLYISAHAGKYGGHRRQLETMELFNHIVWKGAKKEVMEWLKACKHCLHATDRHSIPRPYGPSKRGTFPNEVVSMDHYSFGETRYCVELIDTFTGLMTVEKGPATSETGVRLLWRWIRERGSPIFIVTDSGSHFLGQIFQALLEQMAVTHIATTPYSPWANGLIERRNRIFNFGIRAVSNELRAQKEDWFEILLSIVFNINRNGGSATKGISPIEMWNGQAPRELTDQVMVLSDTEIKFIDASTISTIYTRIRADLDALHVMVRDHHAELEIEKVLHQKNYLPNFTIGDYVLVAIPAQQKQEKSQVRWKGPYQVIGTKHDYVYQVEDLISKRTFYGHACRMIFYDSSKAGTICTAEFKLKEQAALTSDGTFFIEDLLEYHPETGVLVKWWGFDEPSWNDFQLLIEDAPDRMNEFYETLTDAFKAHWDARL